MILEKAGLPPQTEKLKMFEEASKLLQAEGYCAIGMDHFVLPDDDLNVALQHQTLHRNFQGYCPRRITAQVYAFGVSGISQLDEAYAQNTKRYFCLHFASKCKPIAHCKRLRFGFVAAHNTRSNRMYYVQQLCELERYG